MWSFERQDEDDEGRSCGVDVGGFDVDVDVEVVETLVTFTRGVVESFFSLEGSVIVAVTSFV